MYTLITVLIFIVCILLILIVLVQNSKGGGLASNFSSSNQVMGVRKTADFLEKATWTLAIALLSLSLFASLSIPRDKIEANKTELEEKIENAKTMDPNAIPSFPTAPEKKDQENSKGE